MDTPFYYLDLTTLFEFKEQLMQLAIEKRLENGEDADISLLKEKYRIVKHIIAHKGRNNNLIKPMRVKKLT